MSVATNLNINAERSATLPSNSPSSTSSFQGRQIEPLSTTKKGSWSETSRKLLHIAAIIGSVAIFAITILASVSLNAVVATTFPYMLTVTVPISILALGLANFTFKYAVGITPKAPKCPLKSDLLDSHNNLSTLERALIRAADDGDLSAVQSYLKSGQSISKSALYRAVFAAVDSGDLPVLKHLLSDGRSISEIALCQAILRAIGTDYESVVEFLLSKQTPIKTDQRDFLVSQCSGNRHKAILKLLLQNGPITKAARDYAIQMAENWNADEIRELLSKATLADTNWDYVLGTLRAMYC